MRLVAAVASVVVAASGCGGDDEMRPATPTLTKTQTSAMETIDDLEVDLSLLPPELRPLAPLIRKYAAGDDDERTDRLFAASTPELYELERAMTPARFDAAEAFLDAHLEQTGTPEQDVALVLSSFAEAAAEATVVLERRERQD